MPSEITDEIAASLREMDRLAGTPASGASAPPPEAGLAGYAHATRTATYGFLAAIPLLILYEIGILLSNTGFSEVRVGADVWLKQLLGSLGVQGGVLLAAVVIVVGGVVFWMERERRPRLVPAYFGGILLESTVYAVVLAFIVSALVGVVFGAALSLAPPEALAQPLATAPLLAMAQMAELSLPLQLSLSIGAGLYEELVFRVILVGGMFWGLKRLMEDSRKAYVIAAVIGALLFSAVHYTGSMGDPFELASFTYRFVFGLALNGVFLLRGFALAAWTHAIYDVLVVTGAL